MQYPPVPPSESPTVIVHAGPVSAAPQHYTVKPGDSLRKIAHHFYGDEHMWHVIYRANQGRIINPNLIYPGQRFIIPQGASLRPKVPGKSSSPRQVHPARPAPPPGVPQHPSEAAVIRAVLSRLGAPLTAANVHSMEAWYAHENSAWPPAASFNPWNSTMPAPGATIFNSVGVRNYVNWGQGVGRTAATLNNGNYPNIVARLRYGQGLCGWSSQEFGTWSGGGYFGVCP